MLKLDYELRDLEWDEKKKLGVGTFAVVHPGILNTGKLCNHFFKLRIFHQTIYVNIRCLKHQLDTNFFFVLFENRFDFFSHGNQRNNVCNPRTFT
jgi:hypothetical protein